MKTPLQQLIEKLHKISEIHVNDLPEEREYKSGLRTASLYALGMLEKEEEFIKEVYWEGGQEVPAHETSVDNWYNKTFNTKNNCYVL